MNSPVVGEPAPGAALFTPLQRIDTDGGEVLKALRSDEPGFAGVAEAYFSRVDPGSVRAWKLHTEMTVNVVVPVGHARFVIAQGGEFETHDLGPDHNYGRLTIQPGNWFGFKGGDHGALVLNLANILHHPDEGQNKPPEAFDYRW